MNFLNKTAATLVLATVLVSAAVVPSWATIATQITKIYNAYRQAGERNEDSLTGTDYMSTSEETVCTAVDTATDSTTVYNFPALVSYVYVNTVLSAHTVVIKDNTTAKFTLPASLAAGSSLKPPGAQMRTSLVVDPDDSSTGNITVCYRPMATRVNY